MGGSIGGGLKVLFLDAFLTQERNKVQAHVEKTSYAQKCLFVAFLFAFIGTPPWEKQAGLNVGPYVQNIEY